MKKDDLTTRKYKRRESQDIDSKNLALLSPRERKYFNIMRPQNGVLFITSKPGFAKSATARSIANKLGFQYMDIRLSMVDETDVGLFPDVQEFEGRKILDHIVPKWAEKANQRPTIIHFEELNRASLSVRNAALQILLEREIGTEFAFNQNVYMLASGNLGEEDGTDVEEFDSALNNRLIHVKHDLEVEEWIKEFANDNIHPAIVSYIKNNPEEMYKKGGDQNQQEVRAYASPRSWAFLSDYIYSSVPNQKDLQDTAIVRDLLSDVAMYYIGNSSLKFLRYLDETMRLSIKDVLNNFDKFKEQIENSNRDKKSELLNNLKEMNLQGLKSHQVENLISFLHLIDEDERVGYLTHLVDNGIEENLKKAPYSTILKSFKDLLRKISSLS